MRNRVVRLLRGLANRIAGETRYSCSATFIPKTKDGALGARVIVEYDDPVDAVRALAILGKPSWLAPAARALGAGLPLAEFSEDAEDAEDAVDR